ncbi:hypothetical protein [Nocardia tengchongensis]
MPQRASRSITSRSSTIELNYCAIEKNVKHTISAIMNELIERCSPAAKPWSPPAAAVRSVVRGYTRRQSDCQ